MKQKRVFISDIHMSDSRSVCPGNSDFPYSLLTPPSTTILEKFLDYIYSSKDIAELVILGDLFDTWTCPASIEPVKDYSTITEAKHNLGIVERLKQIAESRDIKLTYLPGCHDSEINPGFVIDTFPGINILASASGTPKYSFENISAEHGSRFSLFCSDTASREPYPPGYYIARILAESRTKTGKALKLPQTISAYVKKNFKRRDMVEDTFNSILQFCRISEDTPIKIREKHDSTSVTATDIARKFHNLFRQWHLDNSKEVDAFTGLITDTIGLSEAAHKVYFGKGDSNIVIMGHTHEAELQGFIHSDTFPDSFSETLPCKYIYANTGAWINGINNHTYIETEEYSNRSSVKLYRFTGNKHLLLKERYTESLTADNFISAKQLGV